MILKLLDRSGGFRLVDGATDVRFSGSSVAYRTASGETVEELFGRAFILNANGDTIESYPPRQEGRKS